jgi:serine/threonine protein kinase/Tol biopolymer transport system component
VQQAFLESGCGHDVELRREVEMLLAFEGRSGAFLEEPALPNSATPASPVGAGRQFGSYKILSLLGVGGMGVVYRAHDSKLGRDVAVKMLPIEFATDPNRLVRFRREARALATLNHPNIAAIYGLEEFNQVDYLVLELVDGETLSERIKRTGAIPLEQALDYAQQIADALKAAHSKGIIHRDLKPANTKVTPEGRVKVLDFGLAKAVWGSDDACDDSQRANETVAATLAGHIVGTPGYMSPEQASGRTVDKRTDIWAFGCLLYELLSGTQAFQGETLADITAAVLEQEPPWEALPSKIPAKIRGLLRRCLQKDANGRPQEITEALRTINEVIGPATRVKRWQWASAATVAIAILVLVVAWLRQPVRVPARSEWVQLTNFPDSVGQPALSSDGRTLAFIRGPATFYTSGDVYVKLLPDGEPKQLTHDGYQKMSPVFSPDGSRIAYTTVDDQFKWDTWIVPVRGGEAMQWLQNASGLVWSKDGTLLFSEIKTGTHMAIVTADARRAGARDVYVPPRQQGMAHRSYPSSDGKWALIVEMDGPWIPCRLVPLDGSSAGHQVGPADGACTSATWSPDGKWMYFSSSAGGAFHIWRQRFPNGKPEQITSGPTEEEGIAMAPDGRSFITAVGRSQRPVMLHDSRGERPISLEGYAFQVKLAPNHKTLYYRLLKGSQPASDATELWAADVDSGRNEPLLPGFLMRGLYVYDISPGGTEVVFTSRSREGKDRLWLAPLNQRSPPHQIANIEGITPVFGFNGEIFFRAADGFVYKVHEDGTGLQKIIEKPISSVKSISPDGRWLVVVAGEAYVHPLDGGPLRRLGGDMDVGWTPDRRHMWISFGEGGMRRNAAGNTYMIPLSPAKMLPHIPEGGFKSRAELARVPGVRVFDAADVAFGNTLDVYAFSREKAQRNLFRIPLQ